MDQLITLGVFALAAGGILAAAHYIWLEKEIAPPTTYIVGVGWMQFWIILWMLYARIDPWAIGGVIVITGVIGGAILLCYLIDRAKRADRAEPYVQDRRPDSGG